MSHDHPTLLVPPGPVRPGPTAHTVLRPAVATRIMGGFWQRRREVNARVGIPQGPRLLESAGNLHNLRLAAATAAGSTAAVGAGVSADDFRGDYPFMDSDVYKWLEAAAWQLGGAGPQEDAGLAEEAERIIALVAAAQEPDGYLNTWFQVTKGGRRYEDLRWGHEL
jgi:DUF1680 family protein